MGLVVSKNGDYNMPTLAGHVIDLTNGHDLPYPLYVFGVARRENLLYLDPSLPNALALSRFLTLKGVPVELDMPFDPRLRPAIGVSRGMRDDEYVKLAAKVCAFVLFFIHETFVMKQGDMDKVFTNILLENA